MMLTVKAVYDWVDGFAPFQSAEDYDNVGLLTGRLIAPVTRILTALDCTMEVAEEARRLKAELILTHHPLMFHARKNLREDDPEGQVLCALIRSHIALISAHTNLDRAPGGINDVLTQLFSLEGMRGEGFLRCGELPSQITAGELRDLASRLLKAPVRLYGSQDMQIKTLAVGSGAYDEGFEEAATLGAQAYLTGEVRHHNALSAVAQGMVLLEGGHYATEAPGLTTFGGCLQKGLDGLQYSVEVLHFPGVSYPGALNQ
jgi:dinuclear metal center YbgI/SA1388 family protein